MILFVLLINKRGLPRVVQYYNNPTFSKDAALQPDHWARSQQDVIRKCLEHADQMSSSFFEFNDITLVYRKYASLYFIVGITRTENELSILEFIHNIVETFDKYFGNVSELDLMFHLDRVHMILNEMIVNGEIVETNVDKILAPLQVMDGLTN